MFSIKTLFHLILWTCLNGLIYSQELSFPDNSPTSDNPVETTTSLQQETMRRFLTLKGA